jgi:hypothetical protein
MVMMMIGCNCRRMGSECYVSSVSGYRRAGSTVSRETMAARGAPSAATSTASVSAAAVATAAAPMAAPTATG